MAGRQNERRARLVIEALQQAQLRGVVATGWGSLTSDSLPPTIFKIDHAPHDWLFPRMAAVHHGGVGQRIRAEDGVGTAIGLLERASAQALGAGSVKPSPSSSEVNA
jgi:hypothetical protein